MKTSLGIWAFGPMITRFVPGGYQPSHNYETEPVAAKVHRAVEGLGDLIDGYGANVAGFLPSKGTLNLDSFGHGFRSIWFA